MILTLDVILRLFGFGYPIHFEQENIERFPHPGDTFRGKPNVLDHNEFGFRGVFGESAETLNVAIFGGSTVYNGAPPIIELVRSTLERDGLKVNVYNFGSVSSNHSQHVYRLLDFSDRFSFDFVIFYGGVNESIQYGYYDARPGAYPYNFFFRNELNPFLQFLLRYSSILGTVDQNTGAISGLKAIRAVSKNPDWLDQVVNNYWRDLAQGFKLTKNLVQPNVCAEPIFLSVMQPAIPSRELDRRLWLKLLESQKNAPREWLHIDLSTLDNDLEFTDFVHITQASRAIVADRIATLVKKIYQENCL